MITVDDCDNQSPVRSSQGGGWGKGVQKSINIEPDSERKFDQSEHLQEKQKLKSSCKSHSEK